MQMIREVMGARRLPVFFAAILAVLLFAAPPQVSAENIELTAFTATPGDAKVTLKWTVSSTLKTESEIVYHFAQYNTIQGTGVTGTCDSSECDRTGLFNRDEYRFEGYACQDRGTVEICTHPIIVFATPTAE